ncbi:MAG: hypothetical protein ACXV9Q_08865 [Chthoniobacterales bacterium]
MKPVLVALASAFLLGFIGCASDGPTGEEVGSQLGRGIRGEGRLSTDVDRSDDPYVKPRAGGQ